LDYTGANNTGINTGDASVESSSNNNIPKNFDPNLLDSPSQSFGNQTNRNPFGQPTSSFSTPSSNQTGNKKSLFEMMQEQKLQQQLQAQPTGMNFQTPQMTGFQQPAMTGYGQQQQQPPFF
jgi:hypothetical protein